MNEKAQRILDAALNIASSGGSSLINAPFRLAKAGKNVVTGLTKGLEKYQRGLDMKAKRRELEKQRLEKAQQKVLKEKAKEQLAQAKAQNRRLDMIDKATAKMPINQFELPKGVDVNQVVGEAKQKEVAKLNQQAQKRLPQFNKQAQKQKLPSNDPKKIVQKPLDVGAKMNQFKQQQRKDIAKGLANPVVDPTGAKKNKKVAKGIQKELGMKPPKKQPTPVNTNGGNDFENKLKSFWKID